jgi:hypothetical protein
LTAHVLIGHFFLDNESYSRALRGLTLTLQGVRIQDVHRVPFDERKNIVHNCVSEPLVGLGSSPSDVRRQHGPRGV